MPELGFVLPHWLYWTGLLLFPLGAMVMVKRARAAGGGLGQTKTSIAYLCLVTAGFLGMHRYYLKSALGVLFLIPFFGILYANAEARDSREALSAARNDISNYEFQVEHWGARVEQGYDDQDKLAAAEEQLSAARGAIGEAAENFDFYNDLALWLAIAIAAGLLLDALLVPKMAARLRAQEPPPRPQEEKTGVDLSQEPAFYRKVAKVSEWSGEFVAYWAVIAVFVYYYEVVARYIFNSPTNWAHESMFLMFGMQYLISGAYAYLTESHVRVDVFYARLSAKGKAFADLLTSVFFFIFAGTMLVTGWIFTMDAYQVSEFSFSEWQIVYWPVKATIFLGALLIIVQGLNKLARDVLVLIGAFTPPEEEEPHGYAAGEG